MTPSHMRRLADIVEKPGISPMVKLVTTRRICRVFAQGLSTIYAERRALKRMAAKQKEFLPFTRQRVADLDRQAREHRSESLEHLCDSLAGIGIDLLLDREGLAASLGFDRLCDVLSINPVHRDQARQEGKVSICSMAYAQRLEDSSERHGDAWGDGGPMYQACLRGWLVFVEDCYARDIDPFAPGEAFGPKPPKLSVV
ncbi:hypothetical protein PS914_05332 [Pseudomonas fluorescens]|uniref:hypothetical protein n=1 Tax=Pseudomonas fluorescens TaxID=294 RepID=UPI001241C0EA|nr:hypothetical protein [Pseudomonas fluorescens]VVQ12236.1 hypothetical protein PS914_05332 [Pseudomonas fluorescens]